MDYGRNRKIHGFLKRSHSCNAHAQDSNTCPRGLKLNASGGNPQKFPPHTPFLELCGECRRGGRPCPTEHRATVSFRASDRCHCVGIRNPRLASLCEGGGAKRRKERKNETGGVEPRPYARFFGGRSVGGDAHIAPPRPPARNTPEGVSKEGGPQPSLFGRFKVGGFSRGKGNRNPFPLEWRFWLLLSPLTKVTRRRQNTKRRNEIEIPLPLNGVLWILSFAKERKYPAGGKKEKEKESDPHRGAEHPFLAGNKRRAASRRPFFYAISSAFQHFSNTTAVPIPPPMHRVARPFLASGRFCISCSRVTMIRAPDAPTG